MEPYAAGVRQHETHSALAGQTGPQDTSLPSLDLDAIIVPATRPAAHLDHAVTLARAADCWLLVLCSQQLHSTEATKFLAARSHPKAIVIDLPLSYSHELLYFPGLLSLKNELPSACNLYVTDLSMKRNLGLVLARMLGWHRIFFLDDDIRDITHPDLQSTVNMLGSFSAAGLWVTDFPDNSIVCHANRMTDGAQDVFVSGAALAVDCVGDIGFFPDIFNEDWLFFFDNASQGRLANSYLKATQLCYYPFAKPRRAAWQEFGDVVAEGLYALLHLGGDVQHATAEYWGYFLEERRNFLEAIITRSQNSHPDIRDEMLLYSHPDIRDEMLLSVQAALKCSLMIKPDLCERYVQLWRGDLADWKRRVAGIPVMPSVEEALVDLRLAWPRSVSAGGRFLPRRSEAAPGITAGAVTIPRFDTVRAMAGRVGAMHFDPAIPEPEKRDTKPFPILTEEYSAAMLLARTNGSYSPWAIDEAGGRTRLQRLGTAMSRLKTARPWQRGQDPSTPSREPELVGLGEPTAPEQERAAALR